MSAGAGKATRGAEIQSSVNDIVRLAERQQQRYVVVERHLVRLAHESARVHGRSCAGPQVGWVVGQVSIALLHRHEVALLCGDFTLAKPQTAGHAPEWMAWSYRLGRWVPADYCLRRWA